MGDYQRAVDCLERAVRIQIATGNKRGDALTYKYLGSAVEKLGDYQRAKDYLDRARKIQKETET